MAFVIAPLSDVKSLNNYPEYIEAMKALEANAIARATELWGGAKPGGIMPGDKEFGIGPIRKNDAANDTTDSTPSGSYSFRINYTATGWRDIFRYTTRKDMIHAFAGFLVADDVLRITQLRLEIGRFLFPIWDIQEAQRYDRFALLIKMDAGGELVADPSTRILLRSYVESIGWQRVVPLGFMLFRRPDLVLTET